MYYRICSNQFKTDTQDIEKTLARVGAYFRIDIDQCKKDQDIQMVQRGETFVKYGKRGEPHARFVFISSDEDYLVWCVKDFSDIQPVETKSFSEKEKNACANHKHGSTTHGKESKVRKIALKDIIDIKVGNNATDVLKKHNIPKEFDTQCLSIVTEKRTLDLKANDFQTRNKWVQYFYDRVMKEKFEDDKIRFVSEKYAPIPQNDDEPIHKQGTLGQVSKRQRKYAQKWGESESHLEEIWMNEIMTNLEAHWDFINHRPAFKQEREVLHYLKLNGADNLGQKQENANTNQGFFSFFSCFSVKTKAKHSRDSKTKSKSIVAGHRDSLTVEHRERSSVHSSESPFDTVQNQRTKFYSTFANVEVPEVCLEDLWRLGIPVAIRKVLWPFKIENKLGITQELYTINMKRGLKLMLKVV